MMNKQQLWDVSKKTGINLINLYNRYGLPEDFTLDDIIDFHKSFGSLMHSEHTTMKFKSEFYKLWDELIIAELKKAKNIFELTNGMAYVRHNVNRESSLIDFFKNTINDLTYTDFPEFVGTFFRLDIMPIFYLISEHVYSVWDIKSWAALKDAEDFPAKLKLFCCIRDNNELAEAIFEQMLPIPTYEDAKKVYARLATNADSAIKNKAEEILLNFHWQKNQ